MASAQQRHAQLRQDRDHQHNERDPDEAECHALTVQMNAGQLLDNHNRRKYFDQRIGAEACEGNRTRQVGGCNHKHNADDIPAERQIFQPESSLQQG